MTGSNVQEMRTLIEMARALSPLHRKLLTSLADGGPALLFELAVSVLKFPEETSEPVQELRNLGLVEANTISGGQFGNEVLGLTAQGRQMVRLLRDESLKNELQPAAHSVQPATNAADPSQTQVELLRKLGDVAAQQGNLEQAREWYEKALTIAQESAGQRSTTGGAQ